MRKSGGFVREGATFARVTALSTSPRTQTFAARGKLMLTGEYLVLDGARSLAVPTTLGQRMAVERTDEVDVLHWTSVDVGGVTWLEAVFSRRALRGAPGTSQATPRARLARMLSRLLRDHPLLWPAGSGLRVDCRLEFARDWGLGSSSTLAYLLAAWAGADAMAVNAAEFGGSGYDVACAGAGGPLVYRLDGAERTPRSEAVAFAPPWLRDAYLVHLGRKQDSREGIRDYRALVGADLPRFVREVDEITAGLLAADSASAAAVLLRQHEALIGYVTHQAPVGKARFGDFPGVVKSLGAWGGDFALALPQAGADAAAYFRACGSETVLPAGELLLLDAAPVAPLPTDPSLWPVFFYGELALPDAEREWLGAYAHFPAQLLDYGIRGLTPGQAPQPAPGQRTEGLLVYLPPPDVVALDLHPRGTGYRRRHAAVQVGGRRVQAQVWLNAEG